MHSVIAYYDGVIIYTWCFMERNLTQRQELVLNIIAEKIKENGRPPSIPELMEMMNISSPNGIAKHLHALETKGYIVRDKGARGIKLTQKSGALNPPANENVAYLPLLGQIAAGAPILAEENVEEIYALPDFLIDGTSDTFLLRVKGESMIEEGILPGDLVMVSKCDTVSNGELAAVLVDDEATVKRFFREPGRVVLQPANKYYEPIIIEDGSAQCSIIGKITGLIRSYRMRL